jgi:hypothetical protein
MYFFLIYFPYLYPTYFEFFAVFSYRLYFVKFVCLLKGHGSGRIFWGFAEIGSS